MCLPKYLEAWKHCLGVGDMAENKTDKNQIPYGASILGRDNKQIIEVNNTDY